MVSAGRAHRPARRRNTSATGWGRRPCSHRPACSGRTDRHTSRCPVTGSRSAESTDRFGAHDGSRPAWSTGASRRGRRERHPLGLSRVPTRDALMEVQRTGPGRVASDDRRLTDDAGRAAHPPRLRRGRLVLVAASWTEPTPPLGLRRWDADPDRDWRSAAEHSPDRLHALWQDAVDRSRSAVTEALTDCGLAGLSRRPGQTGDHRACVGPSAT